MGAKLESGVEHKMAIGTVTSFNVDLGSGVVTGDDGNIYTVDHKDIAGMTVGASSFRTLRVDQRVTFESESHKAINVRLIR